MARPMRILVTSTPGIGHLSSLMPLCAELRSAGHDLLIATGPESSDLVQRHGFAVREAGMTSDARRAAFAPRMAATMALPPRQRRGMFFAGFFADIAAPAMRVDLIPIFEEFKPDIVIHERGELASGPLAVARGIPHVTVAFSGALPQWAAELLRNSIAPVWAEEGLAVPTMEQINGDLYLHPFPPSFGQAPTGGRVCEMRAAAVETAVGDPPAWLEELGRARPLVYLTAGTEAAAAELFPWSDAIAALAALDVDAIATVGPRFDPAGLGVVPPNIRVERFVPQHFILDKAAVAMSHAGAGSVLGAAADGVPQVVFPIRADQYENADAASGAGVAITLEMEQRAAGYIRIALDRVMHEATFKLAATNVAEEIAGMPSPADHVATIEALAEGEVNDE
jgi:UDP:flavonoid glycosyltransferase YjiC (YdhE family)